MSFFESIGMLSALILPIWNIPLILKIWKRKSSEDISFVWVVGVWSCIIGMLPSAITSPDRIFKILGILNSILFTGVFLVVLKFRHKS